jgi:two-component system LytT family response regulator
MTIIDFDQLLIEHLMGRTKILIVDDDHKSQDELQGLLESHFTDVEITGTAYSVEEAKLLIESNEPDLVYLDVMMPEADGFELLRHYPDRNFEVILTTASADFGIKGIKSGAIDYILKPATEDDLTSSIETYRNLVKKREILPDSGSQPERIAITTSSGYHLEELKNIIRLEADSNYTRIHIIDKPPVLVSKPLKVFEATLIRHKNFIRIHKSHLINLDHVCSFSSADGGTVILADNSKHPVSKRKNPDFFDALSRYSIMVK